MAPSLFRSMRLPDLSASAELLSLWSRVSDRVPVLSRTPLPVESCLGPGPTPKQNSSPCGVVSWTGSQSSAELLSLWSRVSDRVPVLSRTPLPVESCLGPGLSPKQNSSPCGVVSWTGSQSSAELLSLWSRDSDRVSVLSRTPLPVESCLGPGLCPQQNSSPCGVVSRTGSQSSAELLSLWSRVSDRVSVLSRTPLPVESCLGPGLSPQQNSSPCGVVSWTGYQSSAELLFLWSRVLDRVPVLSRTPLPVESLLGPGLSPQQNSSPCGVVSRTGSQSSAELLFLWSRVLDRVPVLSRTPLPVESRVSDRVSVLSRTPLPVESCLRPGLSPQQNSSPCGVVSRTGSQSSAELLSLWSRLGPGTSLQQNSSPCGVVSRTGSQSSAELLSLWSRVSDRVPVLSRTPLPVESCLGPGPSPQQNSSPCGVVSRTGSQSSAELLSLWSHVLDRVPVLSRTPLPVES
ncbi:unnamed protein product [Leuciscus chuanchicus]